MKLEILYVGKTKEKWIVSGMELFLARLSRRVSLQLISKKDDEALLGALKGVEEEAVYLDPAGAEMDSLKFHAFLFQSIQVKKKVIFVIGGASGFPPSLASSGFRLSLSKMTFTHEMTLLFLTEQIYRAFEIEKNSGYHK